MRLAMLGFAFVSVNLEFLFVWLYLLARYTPWRVALGQAGVTVGLVLIAWAASLGLQLAVPTWLVGGAGLVPLVWALHAPTPPAVMLTVVVLTARCQLALYLPVLVGATWQTVALGVGLILGLTPLLSFGLASVARHPAWADTIATRAKTSTTTCYVAAGVFVALDTGLVEVLLKGVRA
ncbi:hypothetical protein [Lacticaseibacillus daqingensis]|uniref:hypothetical protein n=1 Tax=Lacticaseibacillus daqingensis TaxID=2486014 RepID=UPI000F7A721A|nr:hypothetical protein [Lacticaseibacillus daqingensis]